MKIESFDHIHIYSKDPEKSANFYIKHFEAKEVYKKEGASGKRVFLSLGGQIIVLGPLPSNRSIFNSADTGGKHQIGLDHFGIRVKKLKDAVQELREAGIEILAEPVKGGSGISFAFIAAPDRVTVELTEYGLLPKMYLKAKKII